MQACNVDYDDKQTKKVHRIHTTQEINEEKNTILDAYIYLGFYCDIFTMLLDKWVIMTPAKHAS